MKFLKDKLVVYDSDCPMCSGMKEQALRFGVIAEGDYTSYRDLPAEYSAAVDPDRFRDEMALVDRSGGQTVYGSEGLMQVFSTRYPLLEPLFGVPSLRSILTALYKIVAPNRYVLSTPRKEEPTCACLAAGSRSDRLKYIVLGLLFTSAMTILFAWRIDPGGTTDWPILVVAIASGWFVYLLVAAVVLRRIFLEFASHMVSVMWRGTLPLLPVILVSLFTSSILILLPLAVISIIASFGYMYSQHERRRSALCLKPRWTLLWAVLIWSGLACVLFAWRYAMLGVLYVLFWQVVMAVLNIVAWVAQ